jgi:NADP-dependent 3-hydroxy acid dehydrogenase YdfG
MLFRLRAVEASVSNFSQKVAVVTGAASGIGKAFSRALLARGARVVLTDIDAALLETTRSEFSGLGAVEAERLDVTDAAAVAAVVEGVAARHGRIDFMFNNAGIAIFGNARDMTLDDWNRLIDINIRGVVHGVAAAYPMMTRQGSGHIVNTASVAGLAPTPGGTGYSMTKHAVVGLSTSLRAEASRYGVRVTAVCPGFIDTPIVQNAKMINLDREQAMKEFHFRLHSSEDLAEAVMRGIERNKPIVIFTGAARAIWGINRLSPALLQRLFALGARRNNLLVD